MACAHRYEPEAGMHWACLAAAVAERHELAISMMQNAEIKRTLVYLAGEPQPKP